MSRYALFAASILCVAACLRIPDLAARPMHADEAILAYKLGNLLETGKWIYEPGEHHGPVLHYLTVIPSRLSGADRHVNLTEWMLRVVPVLAGLIVVAMPLFLASGLGRTQALVASALTAISPGMVYYSRYYIPEMLLTCLTAVLITLAYRYIGRPALPWALAAGLLFGLMIATKETALIAGCCVLVAAALTARVNWKHLLLALFAAAAVVVLLLGLGDTVESFRTYINRTVQGQRHVHPWHYYLNLMFRNEAVIVILAAIGAWASRQDRSLPRFLTVYTILMTLIYSLLPYKTPWCLLGFLYGMILLAGIGVVFLVRVTSGFIRLATLTLIAGLSIHLTIQAVLASYKYSSDSRNPYAYAHTTRDVYTIRERLEQIGEGRDFPIQVISAQNVWPLPWYLRSFPRVEWRRAVTDDMQAAPVILATPDMEPALFHHLYEVQPPGQRPLYVSLFQDYTELRPGLELRGYMQQSFFQ